ncbi:MAG: DsbA family protein [Polyangiaceae bacterium]
MIDETRAAFGRVFGVPTFRVDQELYWGQDRLDFSGLRAGSRARRLDGTRQAEDAQVDEIEFFFDYSSPFAYLAHTQIAALEQASGARGEVDPVSAGCLFKAVGTGDVPLFTFPRASTQMYVARDIDRYAKRYGVGFRFLMSSRCAWRRFASVPGRQATLPVEADARRLSDALFSAFCHTIATSLSLKCSPRC